MTSYKYTWNSQVPYHYQILYYSGFKKGNKRKAKSISTEILFLSYRVHNNEESNTEIQIENYIEKLL